MKIRAQQLLVILVVQASVDYFMSLINYLGQETTVITGFITIKKKYPERYGNIVVRLGGFHVTVNFMGAVGYLMKGSGIKELLVESSACNKGTAEKVLNGKDYYKMLRFHLLLSDAITGLLWKEFEQWLVSENALTNIYDHVLALSDSLK